MRQLAKVITKKMASNNGVLISIGIVYLWFGGLKFFTGVSPAEALAINTIDYLFLGKIPSDISIVLLAIWETVIGLFLIGNLFRKFTLLLALVHIVLTFTPFLFSPELTFTEAPFGLTILGQYIVKNIIILAVLLFYFREGQKAKIKE
ncbi:MAG: doxx family protein [Flavobacteriaceae bacterium]